MPLEYLLSIMRDSKKRWPVRFEAAKAAAPYLHPRLAQVSTQQATKTIIEVKGGIPKEEDDPKLIEGTAVEVKGEEDKGN